MIDKRVEIPNFGF